MNAEKPKLIVTDPKSSKDTHGNKLSRPTAVISSSLYSVPVGDDNKSRGLESVKVE